MSQLGSAKIIGGIGVLLSLLAIIPYAGALLSLIGIVMIFIAVHYIADETKNHKIFQDYLMNFIFQIIAIVAIIIIMIAAFGISGGLTWITSLQEQNFTDLNSVWNTFGTMITACIAALLIAWIFLILGAIYLRKSYNSIAEHTKVNLFKTTGTVYLIGAVTLIVVIGVVIIFVAKILELVSYFSLPETLPTQPTTPPTTVPPPQPPSSSP
jgi:uncharacterized membrane protein